MHSLTVVQLGWIAAFLLGTTGTYCILHYLISRDEQDRKTRAEANRARHNTEGDQQ